MHTCACKHSCMAETHGVRQGTPVDADQAERVARFLGALSTGSRVRILARLRQSPCSVGELAESVDMAQPAVSHQLRILRDRGLVVGVQKGRVTEYALNDPHLAVVLDEALRHIDHVGRPAEPHPSQAK